MLSVLTVSYNCLDFIKLQILSVRRFSTWPHEIIIIDNASSDGSREWLREQPDVRLIPLANNIGHGRGLDMALMAAKGEHCLILDADAHVQRNGYEDDLLALYQSGSNVRLVAAKGTYNADAPDAKPIHAAFMFFEPRIFKDFGFSFVAVGRHDVGRKVFYDLRDLGLETVRVESGVKFYDGVYGDNYYFNGKPTIYHNWYSSRMWQKDLVDNYERVEFDKYKTALFNQSLVKEILEEEENLGRA
jgi:glycosyltransferase involved in cell wall biosynthesis